MEMARKGDGQRTRTNRACERYGRKRLKREAAKRGEKRAARESRPKRLKKKANKDLENDKRLSAQILCRNHRGKQVEKETVERGQEPGRGQVSDHGASHGAGPGLGHVPNHGGVIIEAQVLDASHCAGHGAQGVPSPHGSRPLSRCLSRQIDRRCRLLAA